MKLILPILAILCTILITLAMLGMCMGMGANASPAQIRRLKIWMSCLSLLSLVGIVASCILMSRQPNIAAGVAILPSVIMFVIFVIALLK